MVAKKTPKQKKNLLTWVSILIIVVALAVIGIGYAYLNPPGGVDEGFHVAKPTFFVKIQNPAYAKILSQGKRESLAGEGYIPEAWATVPPDYGVPWEQASKAAEMRQFIKKYGDKN